MSRRRSRAMRSAGRTSVARPSLVLPRPLGVRRVDEPSYGSVFRRRHLAYLPSGIRRSKMAEVVAVQPSRGVVDKSYAALRSLWMLRPSRVSFCVGRKVRRQVLFALDRAGRSGSAPKRHYRRTGDSLYSC